MRAFFVEKTCSGRLKELPYNVARPGSTATGIDATFNNRWAIAGDNMVADRPEVARIVATIVFSHAKKYVSREEFRNDEENHRIGEGGNYDWDGSGDMYGWYVAEVRRLYEPIEQAGPKGTTGFTRPRSFSVRFA